MAGYQLAVSIQCAVRGYLIHSMQLLDGKAVADAWLEELRQRLAERSSPLGLKVFMVGDDPASQTYVRNKARACARLGINYEQENCSETVSEEQLLALINEANADPRWQGIIVQLPLPGGLSVDRILEAIDPTKDVDGFHPLNMGRLTQRLPSLRPATPGGVLKLLEHYGLLKSGLRAVVIGKSRIVGMPLAIMLAHCGLTVTCCDVHTKDLSSFTRSADLIISAAGVAGLIRGPDLQPGAICVDVGFSFVEGRVRGDFDKETVAAVAGWYSPVPGGVGPMTVAQLMWNIWLADQEK